MVAPGPGGPWYSSPLGIIIEVILALFVLWLIFHLVFAVV